MRITEKIRDKILLHLPKGYAKIIADSTGVSHITVYRVLHQEYENYDVANALVKLAHDTKKQDTQRQKQINSVLGQL